MSTLNLRSMVVKALRASRPVATRGALLALSISGAAFAQQQASTAGVNTLDEIVVTGIRRGIQDAVEVKRDSTNIVEAISAEDIGKLPDTSIAESISRLPGVTAQRAAGKSSAISIRGTDPAFTNGLLNGREQVSTGDNRDIEFDQYPSELISQVIVYKTPDAQLIGQGLAGTIDLRTVRPLEYGKTAFAANVRGERNSNGDLGANSKKNGTRFSLSYIDQFADNTVGLAVGIARLDSPLATRGVGAYGPWHPNCNTSGCDGYNYHTSVADGVYVTNGMKIRADMGDNKRTGAMATLEFRPNENFTSTLDAYYTKSDTTDDARSLEWNLGNYPATTDYSNNVIVDNTLVGATVANVRPLVRNFQFITNDKIQSVGWNNKFKSGDWTVVGDLAYSKATRDQWQPETNAQYGACGGGDPACTDTATFSFSTDHMPQSSLLKYDYADPTQVAFGNTIYGLGWAKAFHVVDTLKSARIDVSHDGAGWFDSFTGGVNVTKRNKDKQDHEGGWNFKSGFGPSALIDSQYLYAPTNLSYGGVGNALAWNVPAVLGAYFQPWAPLSLSGNAWLIGKNWSVDETVTTASLRGNLNHEISSSVTLKGNVGLQFIHTKQSSSSYQSINGAVAPFTAGTSYNDVLPQINLAFVLPDQNTVRVGIAREMARPRLDQLKASVDQGIGTASGNLPGGSGGNPLLKPWRADAFDLSWEKYFANKGYVSAAVFFKKLKTYIYNSSDATHDFSAMVAELTANGYFPTGVTPETIGTLNLPQNGQGGNLKGIELSASLPGELLSSITRDFGLLLSVAQTDSNIVVQDPPSGSNSTIASNGLGNIPLPGLSKTVWNATAYYEHAGFSARIATRARSKYIGEITNFSNDRTFQFVKGNRITDFQTSYEWQEGKLKGLSVLFQINNLTNEPYVAYQTNESRMMDYQTYGKQFMLGVNYKL